MFCFQAEDGIRDIGVTGVQTCALPICVGCIISYGNHDHLIQRHLPTRERLGGLLPGSSHLLPSEHSRSEERRVGKSVDLGGRRIIKKKKNLVSSLYQQ